jgi:predicted ATP-binding protein involved in virulence
MSGQNLGKHHHCFTETHLHPTWQQDIRRTALRAMLMQGQDTVLHMQFTVPMHSNAVYTSQPPGLIHIQNQTANVP